MSNGEIGEAISEFRIASALAPSQKTYAADLAQSLNINKQALSQTSDASNNSKSKSQPKHCNWYRPMSFYFQPPDLAEFPRRFLQALFWKKVLAIYLLKYRQ